MSKLYDETFKSGENKTGYNYKDKLLYNTMSLRFFSGNPIAETFIDFVNKILYESIESVKLIRTFYNYTIKSDKKDIR